MKQYVFYFALLFLTLQNIIAQTPVNDSSWTLIFEDDFENTTLDRSKWYVTPPWCNCDGAAKMTDPDSGYFNHILSNGLLKLTAKHQPSLCWELDDNWEVSTRNVEYTTASILSIREFRYGYFEVRCKMSERDYFNGQGLGAAIWMWRLYDPNPTHDVWWSEIDILEMKAFENRNTFNIHYGDRHAIDSSICHDLRDLDKGKWELRDEDSTVQKLGYSMIMDFSDFHTYSCEWTPYYITFYIDGKSLYTTNMYHFCNDSLYQLTDDLLSMNLWIGTSVGTQSLMGSLVNDSTLLPYSVDVDYVRVYELKTDCENDYISGRNFIPASISPVDFSTIMYSNYDHKIKRNITLRHKLPDNSNYSFRAVQEVNLENGFEIPLGASVFITNSGCPCGD